MCNFKMLSLLLVLFVFFGCTSDNKETETDGDMESNAESDMEFADKTELEAEEEAIQYEFSEFLWNDKNLDPINYRLCKEAADPKAAEEKVFIDCEIEGASYVKSTPEPKDKITVMAYNIERGRNVDTMISAMKEGKDIILPDVLLVSESDRGCERSDKKNVLKELAEEFGMNYVFAVEFTELKRDGDTETPKCEHGNGILSRYPIGNVHQLRHKDQHDWYKSDDEPRLGGRVTIFGDIKIGDKIVHVASMHFESQLAEEPRKFQAAEVAEIGLELPYLFVTGGDINAGFYFLDLATGEKTDQTASQFLDRGYFDAHESVDSKMRVTAPHSGFILDFLFSTKDVFSDPQICPKDKCKDLSDHLPVWATVDLTKM